MSGILTSNITHHQLQYICTGQWYRPFQERHAITHACTHTCAKVFRHVINNTHKGNFWLHVFTLSLPVFDQHVWLYYMHLEQHFFSSIVRFLLMLTTYEKNHIFLAVLVWFSWLLSKYKNSFVFVFAKIYVANIRFEFISSHQRCST